MELRIADIYSPEGRLRLVEAYTKSLWAGGVNHRTTWMGVQTLQTPEDLVATRSARRRTAAGPA